MKTTICSVGDSIFIREFPQNYDWSPIKSIIEKADMRLFNLENVLSDEAIYGSAYCGGVWLVAKEKTLDEVLQFGFNGCSFANNHTMDYSYDGMFSTLNAVRKRNLPVSGAGKDLPEAAAHAVIETAKGKMGLISICSTFNDAARAGNPSDTVPGRPGLNPLRFSTIYEITPDHMKALQEMAEGTCIDGRRNRSRAGGYTPRVPEGCFGFGEYTFRESEVEGKISKANAVDLERTVNSIKRALEECEHVVVNVHSHEIKRMTDDEPDDFMIEFCHACVEAGASAVIGTGTHQLKAIELYKGKPIFYSLGNFIFQSNDAFCVPDDFREKYNIPAGYTPEEQIAWRSRSGKDLHTDVNNFRSLMPFMTFEDGEVREVLLYPLRLNMENGLPSLADEDEASVILAYMNERNQPYGTKLTLENGVIVLHL